MRLRTSESFGFISSGIINSYPSLKQNVNSDYVVIGGGISGALMSHALMEKNFNVILIDRRDIGCGSTAASTSMLQYEIDVPLYKLSQLIGEENAVLCYREGIQAINDFRSLIEEKNFDCDFENKSSLFIARRKMDVGWLKEEFALRDKYKMGVKWLSAEQVLQDYDIHCFGGILSDIAASADIYKLTHKIIAYNVGRGMKVYDQTTIDKFDFEKDRVTLYAANGNTVTCDQIIFCSGYETKKILREKTAELYYTYARISECGIKLSEKLYKTLVWDTGNPYFYMKTTADKRLLIGGEDSNSFSLIGQNKKKEKKGKKLENQLSKILPGVEFVEDFSWGGVFGSTQDGLPYIGRSPELTKALFVLAYGGNGIVFSVQAMKIIIDLLENKENKLSHLYRFGR